VDLGSTTRRLLLDALISFGAAVSGFVPLPDATDVDATDVEATDDVDDETPGIDRPNDGLPARD
jgi:hypothetical protein